MPSCVSSSFAKLGYGWEVVAPIPSGFDPAKFVAAAAGSDVGYELVLRGAALTVGETYALRLTVTPLDANGVAVSAANSANVAVTINAQPLIAFVDGGAKRSIDVGASGGVMLDATASYDPDDASVAGSALLTFQWSCVNGGAQCDFASAGSFLSGSSATSVGLWLVPSVFFAPALAAGTSDAVEVRVVVAHSAAGDARTAAFTTLLSLVDNSAADAAVVPLVELEGVQQPTASSSLTTASIRGKANPSVKLVLKGGLAASQLETLGDAIAYEWRVALVESIASPMPLAQDSLGDLPKSSFLTPINRATLVIAPSRLAPGGSYVFELRATYTSPTTATSTVGVASASMLVNAPPTSGVLEVLPTSGTAGDTLFRIWTSRWIDDDDDLPLRWTFAATTMASDSAASGGDSTQTLSPLHRAAAISNVVLARGDPSASYVTTLSVVAVDRYGAASLPATMTVTVTPPTVASGSSIDDALVAKSYGGQTPVAVARQVTASAGLSNDAATDAAAQSGSLATQQLLRAKMTAALSSALAAVTNTGGSGAGEGGEATAVEGSASTELIEQLAFAAAETVATPSALDAATKLSAVALLVNLSAICNPLSAAVANGTLVVSRAGTTRSASGAVLSANAANAIVGALGSMLVPGAKDAVRQGVATLGAALVARLSVGEAPALVTSPALAVSSQRALLNDLVSGSASVSSSAAAAGGAAILAMPTDAGTSARRQRRQRRLAAVATNAAAFATAEVHAAAFAVNPHSSSATFSPAAFGEPSTGVASLRVLTGDVSRSRLFAAFADRAVASVVVPRNAVIRVAAGGAERADASCAYWEPTALKWTHAGTVVRFARADAVGCGSSHLTDFGARLRQAGTPEVNVVDPIGDAHLLLTYDHTNMIVPILLLIFNGSMLIFTLVGWLVDAFQRHVQEKRNRFFWVNRHHGRAAGRHDFHFEKEFRDESIDCETRCIDKGEHGRECRFPLPCGGGDLNAWSIHRLKCGIDESCCGFVSGGGKLCELVRRIVTEHTVLSIVFATPVFHPVTRPMRATLLWVMLATGFSVEALLWAKDDARLEQKLRVAIIAMICMGPPSVIFTWLFRRVNEFRQHRIAWEKRTHKYHPFFDQVHPKHFFERAILYGKDLHKQEMEKVESLKLDFKRGRLVAQDVQLRLRKMYTSRVATRRLDLELVELPVVQQSSSTEFDNVAAEVVGSSLSSDSSSSSRVSLMTAAETVAPLSSDDTPSSSRRRKSAENQDGGDADGAGAGGPRDAEVDSDEEQGGGKVSPPATIVEAAADMQGGTTTAAAKIDEEENVVDAPIPPQSEHEEEEEEAVAEEDAPLAALPLAGSGEVPGAGVRIGEEELGADASIPPPFERKTPPAPALEGGANAGHGGESAISPRVAAFKKKHRMRHSDSKIEAHHRGSLIQEFRRNVLAKAAVSDGEIPAETDDAFAEAMDRINVHKQMRDSAAIDADIIREVNASQCCWGLDGKIDAIVKSKRAEKTRSAYEAIRQFLPAALSCCVPYARIGAVIGGVLQVAIAIAIGLTGVIVGLDAGYGVGVSVVGIGAACMVVVVGMMNARAGCNGTHEDRILAISTIFATIALYAYFYGVAIVAGVSVDAPRHQFGDACIEVVWELLPVDVVASVQDSLGCCGWTYFDPRSVVVEQDIFGRKRSRGNRLPNDGEIEGGVTCPTQRTARSCAPLPETSSELGSVNSTYTLLHVPASCRAELQCHLGGTGLATEAQFVNDAGVPTWSSKSPLFILATIFTVLQVLAVLILTLATRHAGGDEDGEYEAEVEEMESRIAAARAVVDEVAIDAACTALEAKYDEDDPILQGATMRLQRIWRGWMERRRHFQRVYYQRWETMRIWRHCISGGVYFCAFLWGGMMTYVALLYGVKFAPEQASQWITSSMWALLLELLFQEPVMIIVGSILFSDRAVSRVTDEITALAGI